MDISTIWDDEEPVTRHGIKVPAWIEQDISPSTIAAICQGGCESGAYMPAVTYDEALLTVTQHEWELWAMLEETGIAFEYDQDKSIRANACDFVSLAVELWASETLNALRNQ